MPEIVLSHRICWFRKRFWHSPRGHNIGDCRGAEDIANGLRFDQRSSRVVGHPQENFRPSFFRLAGVAGAGSSALVLRPRPVAFARVDRAAE